MTSSAQTPLMRGTSHSENLTFSALLCEQMLNEKSVRQRNKKTAGQVLAYNSKKFSLTKQKARPSWDHDEENHF